MKKITAFDWINNNVKSEDLFENRSNLGLNKRVQKKFQEVDAIDNIAKLDSIDKVVDYFKYKIKKADDKYKELANKTLVDKYETITDGVAITFDWTKEGKWVKIHMHSPWVKIHMHSPRVLRGSTIDILIAYDFYDRRNKEVSRLVIATTDKVLNDFLVGELNEFLMNPDYKVLHSLPLFGNKEEDSIEPIVIDTIIRYIENQLQAFKKKSS